MCTQNKEDVFHAFCFKSSTKPVQKGNVVKREFLWENIVDVQTKLELDAETNFPLATKEVSAVFSRGTFSSSYSASLL